MFINLQIVTVFAKYEIEVEDTITLYELREKLVGNFYGVFKPCHVQLNIRKKISNYSKILLPQYNNRTLSDLDITDNSIIIAISAVPGCNHNKSADLKKNTKCRNEISFCECPADAPNSSINNIN